MKILVAGIIARYPFGGVTWCSLMYLLGLRALGHEVFYVEDTGECIYDPVENTISKDPGYGTGTREFSSMYAMNSYEQSAAKTAMAVWSTFANINFVQTSDTQTNVGDIRFALSTEVDATFDLRCRLKSTLHSICVVD